MSASAAMFEAAWRVGGRTVTMTVPKSDSERPACIALIWSPDMPRRLTPTERVEYVAGRDAALVQLAGSLGLQIGVLEL